MCIPGKAQTNKCFQNSNIPSFNEQYSDITCISHEIPGNNLPLCC